MRTGLKNEEMGHSKGVTSRLVHSVPVAMRSLKSKAWSKVSKATAHCAHSTLGGKRQPDAGNDPIGAPRVQNLVNRFAFMMDNAAARLPW